MCPICWKIFSKNELVLVITLQLFIAGSDLHMHEQRVREQLISKLIWANPWIQSVAVIFTRNKQLVLNPETFALNSYVSSVVVVLPDPFRGIGGMEELHENGWVGPHPKGLD